jgi:F420H(2)-dependent quinone reductase
MQFWVKPMMATNKFLYRLTGGRLGSRMAGQTVLLLHTVGRKSGKAYTTPTNYYRDGENYVLVASNWGQATNPAWYHNLLHQPSTTIQVKSQTIPVRARAAGPDEYDRLWKQVTSVNDFYVRYQQQTDRKIPLVILEPEGR